MLKIFIAEIIPSDNKGEATLMFGIKKTILSVCHEKIKFSLCSISFSSDIEEYGEDINVINNPGLIPHSGTPLKRLLKFTKNFLLHLFFFAGYNIYGKKIFRFDKTGLFISYFGSDIILVGHDNSFSKFHIPLLWYAMMLKKKTIVYGATIMPKVLANELLKKLAVLTLNKVELITTREEFTYKLLKEGLNLRNPNVFCTADKAFLLEPSSSTTAAMIRHKEKIPNSNRPIIALMMVKGSNVFKAAFKKDKLSGPAKYRRHNAEIANTLDRIAEKLHCYFVFIPHSIGPGQDTDDRLVGRDIMQKVKHKSSIINIENVYKPADLKALLGTFHMTVTERTHGGIASATMNTPTLWISHPGDTRTYGIVGKTLKMEDCLYNIEQLESDSLYEKILYVWNNQNGIIERLQKNSKNAIDHANLNGLYFGKYVLNKP